MHFCGKLFERLSTLWRRAVPPADVLRKHKRRKFPTFGPGGIKTEEKLGECHVRGREGDNISVRNSFQREGEGDIIIL